MEEAPKGITMKTDSNYVDVLDEDKAIAGQKFACLSFISPEHIIKQREMFLFEKFVENFEFSKSMEKYHQFFSGLGGKLEYRYTDILLPVSSANGAIC